MHIINQDIAEQATSLKAGLVDAVTTWDPAYEQMVSQGIGKALYKAGVGQNLGILGLTGPWLEEHGEDGAVRLLKSWIIATWWASNHIEQAHKWFGETSRLEPKLLEAAASEDRYLRQPVKDIRSIDFILSDAEIDDAQAVMDFLYEQKLLTNRLVARPFYDSAPIRRAQSEIAAGNYPDLAKITVIYP
jgi:ABC-type nitrate/sulfonate/bicarbonate transport system substrate-binding protein